MDPDAELLFIATQAVPHPPESSAEGADEEEKAKGVAHLVGLGARVGISNGDFGQSHFGVTL